MLAPGRGRLVLEKSGALANLPSFLLPAFQQSQSQSPAFALSISALARSRSNRRPFSSTSARPSKLGRTPISIPPGVEIQVGEPRVKHDPTTYLRIPTRIVTVQGPLGKLDLEIPPFIKIVQDPESRRAVLSIEDTTEKRQKEMWGTLRLTDSLCCDG